MKHLISFCLTIVIFISGYSQSDSVKIFKVIDEMDDNFYYMPNRKMVVSNKEMTKGFSLDAYLEKNWTMRMITAKLIGIGRCNEKDELILLFENGEKIKSVSWKKFNCEGKAYFNVSDKDKGLLKTQKLVKARITNGRTFESLTQEVELKDKTYFIDLYKELELKRSTVLKK